MDITIQYKVDPMLDMDTESLGFEHRTKAENL